jgi:hypothetical protein
MTDIREDEAELGERHAVVQTQAAEGLLVSPDSPDVDVAHTEGGKRRKVPKQPKAKKVAAAESNESSVSVAGGATAETAADERAGKSEQGGPTNAADDVLAAYPNLQAWPESAGPAPLPMHILTARALGMGPGTKRELAVAAYLRDEAGQFTLVQVAEALRAVLGGEFNVQRNVVKGLEADGLAKLSKITTEVVGTAFHLELTAVGETKVSKWLAEREGPGLGVSGRRSNQ